LVKIHYHKRNVVKNCEAFFVIGHGKVFLFQHKAVYMLASKDREHRKNEDFLASTSYNSAVLSYFATLHVFHALKKQQQMREGC
jgi:hypothetical protein